MSRTWISLSMSKMAEIEQFADELEELLELYSDNENHLEEAEWEEMMVCIHTLKDFNRYKDLITKALRVFEKYAEENNLLTQ
jgi:hypothetical protein